MVSETCAVIPLSCYSAASKIHIHPTTCCRLPHSFPDKSFVRKLCHRIVPAIKQRQRIASQNAAPSSNSCFHPPATPVPNSPSLFGQLDRPLCSFLLFNAPCVLCRGGQPSIFYCYLSPTFYPRSPHAGRMPGPLLDWRQHEEGVKLFFLQRLFFSPSQHLAAKMIY